MKDVLKSLWLNHKKKLIGLLVMILAGVGVLSPELKQAIHEATAPEKVEVVAPAAAPAVEPVAPAAVVAPTKVEEKK